MNDFESCRHLDLRLAELSNIVRPLLYLRPQNLNEIRDRFLLDGVLGDFNYPECQYDTSKVREELAAMDLDGKGATHELLRGVRERVYWMNEVIDAIGDEARIRNASKELFGVPGEALVSRAHSTLSQADVDLASKVASIDAEALKTAFMQKLSELELENWGVHLSDIHLVVTTSGADRCLYIPMDEMFSSLQKDALIAHEIGAHVLRSENGRSQELSVLASGCLSYMSTEEGLAVYAQEKTDTLPLWVQQHHAARVIAVNSVHSGNSFHQTYDLLMAYGVFTEQEAFLLCVRVYRGGGYLKDHIYARGYSEVKEYLEAGGRLEDLYVGKIGIVQIDLILDLIEDDVLKSSNYLPWFI
jgi:uncharacterized protein (TIGR02421 family)